MLEATFDVLPTVEQMQYVDDSTCVATKENVIRKADNLTFTHVLKSGVIGPPRRACVGCFNHKLDRLENGIQKSIATSAPACSARSAAC